jgi:hypothetical protein
MRFLTPPAIALRGVTSAGTRDSYTPSATLIELSWAAPREGGSLIGDRAGGTSIGREERTSRVGWCETGLIDSAFEGDVLPEEDHCL